ncbi:hypothetical protein K4K49_001189 [Colletotrichum sp. SAR 10_70]|nr:hypothetical protein CGCSCA1_v001817 [Colletotrichum siamense]KAI8153517.1 hypothetical protein K4K50_008368 [Colletotrichum sp. SAR 10_71]KAI8181428.1 hypothetical protein K4K49_001189 [Colletotrichum sp. SAR 10_70]KAI8184450.1 hypothetical protein K4K51_012545 [Colletotrichum sp. SAR 10_75]KAI8228820.1 hypothetical protein K4K54_001958 [Colletotrichum sp. SAR 10_86]
MAHHGCLWAGCVKQDRDLAVTESVAKDQTAKPSPAPTSGNGSYGQESQTKETQETASKSSKNSSMFPGQPIDKASRYCASHQNPWIRWDLVRVGRLQCEFCHKFQTEYVFQCKGCKIKACNVCRRNRGFRGPQM